MENNIPKNSAYLEDAFATLRKSASNDRRSIDAMSDIVQEALEIAIDETGVDTSDWTEEDMDEAREAVWKGLLRQDD